MDSDIFFMILYFIVGNFLFVQLIKIYVTRKYIKPFLNYNNILYGKILFSFFKQGFYKKRKKTLIISKSGNISNTIYFNILNHNNTCEIFTVKVDLFMLFINNVEIKNNEETIFLK
jgi:hypothetical protein